tara:strand:+ start:392 stop:763 length:372 start_codon:yes stop_codon:yes gene_type:complete
MSKNGKFELTRKTAKLVFEGDFEGLVAYAKLDVALGLFLEIQAMVDEERTVEVYKKFGDEILISWNMQEDGKDIPPTGDGFMLLPINASTALIEEWTKVVATPAIPLSEQSNSSSILEGIPMS